MPIAVISSMIQAREVTMNGDLEAGMRSDLTVWLNDEGADTLSVDEIWAENQREGMPGTLVFSVISPEGVDFSEAFPFPVEGDRREVLLARVRRFRSYLAAPAGALYVLSDGDGTRDLIAVAF